MLEGLSEREKQVLFYLIQGFSNAQIGERLHLAVNTVKHHVKSILKKWRCHRREHVILQAMHRGLIKADPTKVTT
jgi:DNA-binding NarL/FixJ family response regulator